MQPAETVMPTSSERRERLLAGACAPRHSPAHSRRIPFCACDVNHPQIFSSHRPAQWVTTARHKGAPLFITKHKTLNAPVPHLVPLCAGATGEGEKKCGSDALGEINSFSFSSGAFCLIYTGANSTIFSYFFKYRELKINLLYLFLQDLFLITFLELKDSSVFTILKNKIYLISKLSKLS